MEGGIQLENSAGGRYFLSFYKAEMKAGGLLHWTGPEDHESVKPWTEILKAIRKKVFPPIYNKQNESNMSGKYKSTSFCPADLSDDVLNRSNLVSNCAVSCTIAIRLSKQSYNSSIV